MLIGNRRWILAVFVLFFAAAITTSLVFKTGPADTGSGALTASGVIESDEVVLAAEVSGRLVALPLPEGALVSSGDVIARLDDSLIQIQLAQSTADPATRRQLEVQAEKYMIHAPTGGLLTRLPVHVGEVVTPAQPIASIADLSQLNVTVY